MKELLISEGQKTRQWIEEYATIRNWNKHTLRGLCAIASAHLFVSLQKLNLEPKICEYTNVTRNFGHCFILCNGYVVDVTATQFDIKHKVFVKKYEIAKDQRHFWTIQTQFQTLYEFRQHQENSGWPPEQWIEV